MNPLYTLVYTLGLSALFPREYLKRPPGLRAEWLREKRGYPSIEPPAPGTRTLWVHAVSVGEVIAAEPFIKAFRARRPGWRVVVSTITDTGRAVARQRLFGLAEHVYLPFDLPGCLARAIAHIKPSAFVFMETEIWPNLIAAMHSAGVPVALMNGRISDRSFGRYMRIRSLLRGVLGRVDALCMQDARYAGRIAALGAPPARVHAIGNFKFDLTLPEKSIPWTARLAHPVLVAGSTHRGEEEIMARAYASLCANHPGLSLVLVPRHPERAAEVSAVLTRLGLTFVRRTDLSDADAGPLPAPVVLLDTVGELSAVYRASDIAIMGGSFIPHGGQNPLEPAAWAKPVVCGPHMQNFPLVAEFYDEGAAEGTDADGLAPLLGRLLSDPAAAGAMGARGAAIIERNRGAVSRALDVLDPLLPE
jgi:3-deoxy-D-manno-octulosonic-acid transferase